MSGDLVTEQSDERRLKRAGLVHGDFYRDRSRTVAGRNEDSCNCSILKWNLRVTTSRVILRRPEPILPQPQPCPSETGFMLRLQALSLRRRETRCPGLD